jgi:large subunit ribosomal protein L33
LAVHFSAALRKLLRVGHNLAVNPPKPPIPIIFDSVMAKSKKKAETVFLVCQETGDYNYTILRKPGGEKLQLKKYSPRLRKHTVHLEKKK